MDLSEELNNLMMAGVTSCSNSLAPRRPPIVRIGLRAFEPAPPNSSD